MRFFVFILCLAYAAGEKVQEKRGASDNAATVTSPAPETYNKAQSSALLQKTVAYAPQPQYYSIQPTIKYAQAPAAEPQYQQYQQLQQQPQLQQQIALAQPTPAVKTLTPILAKQPQFSLAGDVSSFSYSSPLVTYNNLGLLNQLSGKLAQQAQPQPQPQPQPQLHRFAYTGGSAVQKIVAPQPVVPVQKIAVQSAAYNPAIYQKIAVTPTAYTPQQVQKVAVAPAPVTYQIPTVQPQLAYPVQPVYQTQAQPLQRVTYVAAPQQKYVAQAQAPQLYVAVPQQHQQQYLAQQQQQQPQPQQQAAHSIPQALYVAAPQYQTYTN